KTNCPFQIVGRFAPAKGNTSVATGPDREGIWRLTVSNPDHNHRPFAHPGAEPRHRRLTEDERIHVQSQETAGLQPRQILQSLRQFNPESLAVSRTIYEATQSIRKEELHGRSPIEALLDDLHK
ncbi:hypothetical protein BJ508DRAFT_199796, partial [Ascobolus immersus RN42]